MRLLEQDNSAILELLNLLRTKGFSVARMDRQGKNVRHNITYDSDDDTYHLNQIMNCITVVVPDLLVFQLQKYRYNTLVFLQNWTQYG